MINGAHAYWRGKDIQMSISMKFAPKETAMAREEALLKQTASVTLPR
jgi:hypothetical protein